MPFWNRLCLDSGVAGACGGPQILLVQARNQVDLST
jgi:hypothetical protein